MLPEPLDEVARKLDEYNKRLSHLERLEFGGAWTFIEEINLALAGTFDFQNISNSFRTLALLGVLRGTTASGNVQIGIRLNADAGNNYDYVRWRTTSAAAIRGGGVAVNNGWIFEPPGSTARANSFAACSLYIPYYSLATINKTLQARNDTSAVAGVAGAWIGEFLVHWASTAVISRIQISEAPGGVFGTNMAVGSILSLYGIN